MIKDYKKKYIEDNREEINMKNKEKDICLCGCEVKKKSFEKHKRTTKNILI
jgi:hypothetical protein